MIAAAELEQGAASVETAARCWRLAGAAGTAELTVAPAQSRAELQRRYPDITAEPATWPRPDPELVPVVLALGPLLAERDAALLEAQANPEGVAWLRACALGELARDPEAVLACLSPPEVAGAAIALAEGLHLPEALRRALAPVLPAVMGVYGAIERRAVHARTALRLIATYPGSLPA